MNKKKNTKIINYGQDIQNNQIQNNQELEF